MRVLSNTADTFTVAPNWGIVPDETSRFLVCHWPKRRHRYAAPGDPTTLALTTAGEVLQDLTDYNRNVCQPALYDGENSVYEELSRELGLEPGDFVHIPVLYRSEGNLALAHTPNMVNCQVFSSELLVPRPFGPRNAALQDVFEQYFEQHVGGSVHFIDDWEWYHIWEGESHCGTNARRAPSDVNWWEHWE